MAKYTPTTGWVDMVKCVPESEYLRMAANGRMCVWRQMKNFIPEEAERGDFFVADVSAPSVSGREKRKKEEDEMEEGRR